MGWEDEDISTSAKTPKEAIEEEADESTLEAEREEAQVSHVPH
jgi:hypothetical protein